jgi:hypothetical protein
MESNDVVRETIIHKVEGNLNDEEFTILLRAEWYLFYLGLFNDIISISDYIVPNGRKINE